MPSTNYDGRFIRQGYLGRFDVTRPYDKIFRPGQKEVMLDDLDQNVVELMYQLKRSTPYMFNADESFTTAVYRHYGTTTPWWIVLMYNGLETPMQIQPGMTLNFPLRDDLDVFIQRFIAPDRTGQLVTI